MVQEKYDTWRLLCCFSKDRIAVGSGSASIRLSSIDHSYGRDATPPLLARCNSRPSPAKELRTRLLFLVSGTYFFLRRLPVRSECAALLHNGSAVPGDFFLDRIVPGVVVPAFSFGASAR